jgi:uncharacterized protein YdeI (YjbR/CyaY-like superfamily)
MLLEQEQFYPESTNEWRQWLQENHIIAKSIWLIYYKKKAKKPTISWSEAVDEALCFGWIDSTAKPIDSDRYKQFFTKRKPTSVWSKVNKNKIKQLESEGKIMPAGFASIAIAKENGSWSILDEVEELIVPKDLEMAFEIHANSKEYFETLSNSIKKAILQWLVLAKRPETRQKRIEEIASLASQQQKPKQF